MPSQFGRYCGSWILLAGVCAAGVYADVAQPAGQAGSPATTNAAAAAGDAVAARRGDLKLTVEADGWFEPVNPLRVRFRPESYGGELRVESAAAHGAGVKKGDVILKLDSADAQRQLDAAKNEFTAAQANLAKAEADVKLGAESDALAAKVQAASEADAKAAIEWWEKVDGPQFVKSLERQVKFARINVDDQQDELDQLKKMYKSEDLTNATADIVVKRAVRQLEIARESLAMTQERTEKGKALEYEQNKRNVLTALAQQQQATASLAAAQAQSKVLRETALVTARAAAETAKRKVDELGKDVAAMTVAAPADGVVLWGDLAQGNWSNNGPDALAAGAKVAPEQKLMMLFTSGETRVAAPVPEDRVARVVVGQPVTVTPRALPERTLAGKVKSVSPAATVAGDPPKYEVAIDIEKPDDRLLPGYRAAVEIDVEDATGVLLVPTAAVSGGKVMLVTGDKAEPREVVTGRSDGEQVEVVRGLNEGDRIKAKFKQD